MLLNNRMMFFPIVFYFIFGVESVLALGACPHRENQPLRYVDIFDGSPEEMAFLIPDQAQEQSGFWLLDYVYDAGRVVSIRCKYADGYQVDLMLTNKVSKCSYTLCSDKTLKFVCN